MLAAAPPALSSMVRLDHEEREPRFLLRRSCTTTVSSNLGWSDIPCQGDCPILPLTTTTTTWSQGAAHPTSQARGSTTKSNCNNHSNHTLSPLFSLLLDDTENVSHVVRHRPVTSTTILPSSPGTLAPNRTTRQAHRHAPHNNRHVVPSIPPHHKPPPPPQHWRTCSHDRTVTFAPVAHVRTHNLILSQHPCCLGGLALDCGWTVVEEYDQALPTMEDEEEEPAMPRRQRRRSHHPRDFRLSYSERKQRLCDAMGWSPRELLEQEYALVCGGGGGEKDNDSLFGEDVAVVAVVAAAADTVIPPHSDTPSTDTTTTKTNGPPMSRSKPALCDEGRLRHAATTVSLRRLAATV